MKKRSKAGGKLTKARRHKASDPIRRDASEAVARSNSSAAGKDAEVAQLTHELNEALERQAATSEVLQVISGSTGDLEPIFRAMLEKAVRYCEAKFGTLYLREGDELSLVAALNVPTGFAEARGSSPTKPAPGGPLEAVMRTKRTVHTPDLAAIQSYAERHPRMIEAVELGGIRTVVTVPMLKDDDLVGVIAVHRREVRPFTEKQIELVQNFAAQAVIAIENARLINELRQRTDDLTQRTTDLTEALEQQTATSEVLQVISGSPGDLEPVFASMLEKAVRICDATFGNIYRWDGDALHLVAARNNRLPLPPRHADARSIALIREPLPDACWRPRRWFTSSISQQKALTLRIGIRHSLQASNSGGCGQFSQFPC